MGKNLLFALSIQHMTSIDLILLVFNRTLVVVISQTTTLYGLMYIYIKCSITHFTVHRNQEIVATAIDMRNMWMHCVYSNHTLLVFDVMDFSQPQINSLFQFHNSCVWDVKVLIVAIYLFHSMML